MQADPRTTWALQVSILELDLIAVLILIMARVIHIGVKSKEHKSSALRHAANSNGPTQKLCSQAEFSLVGDIDGGGEFISRSTPDKVYCWSFS